VAQVAPPPVVVAEPVTRDITEYYETTGQTEEARSVDIKARVTGYLTQVAVTPSSEVKEGALLFVIDKRPYEAAVAQADAEVKLAEARLTRTKADLARAERLRPSGAISQEEYDKILSDQAEAAAAVQQRKAGLATAELDLQFTEIKAPWDGTVSRNYVDEGNLIQLGTSGGVALTNIVQLDPIYVYFDVDEQAVLRFREIAAEEEKKAGKRVFPPVDIGLANQQGYPIPGVIDFVENRLDTSTGTIRVRGRFDNPKQSDSIRLLAPGLFARVRVPMGKPYPALVIPERAVGIDQGQHFVYVVDDENKVIRQQVELGTLDEGDRVITSGLKAGQRVIVEGVQRVRPGMVVAPEKPKSDKPDKPADAAPAS
jgi:RND family efflux transporter MFP subunit